MLQKCQDISVQHGLVVHKPEGLQEITLSDTVHSLSGKQVTVAKTAVEFLFTLCALSCKQSYGMV